MPADTGRPYTVTVVGAASPVVTHCYIARSLRQRVRGLMGRPGIAENEAMWILRCHSIHTCFMRFPIDVAFLDGQLRILAIFSAVPAFRTRACRGADSVLEMSAGRLAESGVEVGDRLAIEPLQGSA